MQSGFRAAEAFVEVTARLDEDRVISAARRAATGMDTVLRDGGKRAGDGLTAVLERAGNDAGVALVGSVDKRLRDGSGRFRAAGVKMSEDVRKGAADDFDRPGWSIFLGLIKKAPEAGKELASGLMTNVKAGFSGPIGPYLIGAVSVAALAAGPVAGGILAGGLLAGLATAGIGAGVALMIKDPKIQHAAGQVGDDIGDTLKSAAEPFRAEILTAIRSGGLAFDRWEPQIRSILATSSTMLQPLVNGVIRLVDNLMPSFVRGVEAAALPIDAIGDGLADTGEAVGDVVDSLADNGPEAAAALKIAFMLVGDSIRMVGGTINILTEGLGLVIELGFKLGAIMRAAGEATQGLPGPLGDIGGALLAMGNGIGENEAHWRKLKEGSTDATAAASAGTQGLSERTKFLALSMGEAIRQAGSLSAAFKLLNGDALSAREAESAYQAAIDNVSASIKENGKTLDLNTTKGRANDAAIRDLIGTVDRKAQATYDEIYATKGATAAEEAARGVYEQGRAQLVKNLTQILGNAGAAKELANKIMGIPKSWGTKVELTDMASKKAQAIVHEIKKINGKTVVIAIKYETHGRAPGEHSIGEGTQLKDRWGGVHEGGLTRARDGVVKDAAMFGPRSPGHYLIAEPETGGELFAPKRGDMRRIKGMVTYAIENWWGGWANFAPEGNGTPASPMPTGGTMRTTHAEPAGRVYNFAPGSIVLDASRIRSLADLADMIEALPQVARAMGGTA